MPRRNAVLPLVAVAALGLVTGCEKQSPWVTMTADGVVVKARATKYCREGGKCNESKDAPTLKVKSGGILGIDVPRSVAEQGWRIGDQGEFRHDHYFALPIPADAPPGASQQLQVVRDQKHGEGVWTFNIVVK
ncbi:MAG TPA: DUF2771 family protein [Frankiaceae bacterium]|nr:DUF2771 family protein [Frankiaceae bacterium]